MNYLRQWNELGERLKKTRSFAEDLLRGSVAPHPVEYVSRYLRNIANEVQTIHVSEGTKKLTQLGSLYDAYPAFRDGIRPLIIEREKQLIERSDRVHDLPRVFL